ncbi:MAG: putative dependent methyltransferase [Acidobacteria bacterium]|jgi:SAM-dependent methyltransferase|nr:putative dependent methyltransferase [Acidobacteriota bacterium]
MLRAGEANRRYFHQAYRTGVHGWNALEPSPYAVAFLKRLRTQVHGGMLLDIGCGEGRHCFAARRLGFNVTGIDYEPLALRRARQVALARHVTGIKFRKASVFSLPFPPAAFDVVLDYGCLHHQKKSDWPAYRGSILRVLKSHGYYVLSVFGPKFRFFLGAKRPWHIAHGAYRRCFTPEEISGLFGRDFEILTIKDERGSGGGFWHVLMQRR